MNNEKLRKLISDILEECIAEMELTEDNLIPSEDSSVEEAETIDEYSDSGIYGFIPGFYSRDGSGRDHG